MTPITIVVFLGALGLFIGSFLNVVIYRIGTGRSFIKGRSKCFSCSKPLGPKELIPVVSFAIQGGKCTRCLSKISPQYPIIELLTSFVFGALAYTLTPLLGSPIVFFSLFTGYAIIFSSLIVISVYDIKHKMIPTSVIYTAIVVASINSLIVLRVPFMELLSGIIFCAAPFALLSFISKERWMGWGDTLLGILIGALLGWERGIAAVILSFWIGAIFSLLAMFIKRGSIKMKSQVPFGPFLAVATLLVFLLRIDIFSVLAWFRIG